MKKILMRLLQVGFPTPIADSIKKELNRIIESQKQPLKERSGE